MFVNCLKSCKATGKTQTQERYPLSYCCCYCCCCYCCCCYYCCCYYCYCCCRCYCCFYSCCCSCSYYYDYFCTVTPAAATAATITTVGSSKS